jgi:hypothetical protein
MWIWGCGPSVAIMGWVVSEQSQQGQQGDGEEGGGGEGGGEVEVGGEAAVGLVHVVAVCGQCREGGGCGDAGVGLVVGGDAPFVIYLVHDGLIAEGGGFEVAVELGVVVCLDGALLVAASALHEGVVVDAAYVGAGVVVGGVGHQRKEIVNGARVRQKAHHVPKGVTLREGQPLPGAEGSAVDGQVHEAEDHDLR